MGLPRDKRIYFRKNKRTLSHAEFITQTLYIFQNMHDWFKENC